MALWVRTSGTEPGAAWCALQAWSAGLSAAPESIRALIAISRLLPVVGKYVRDLTAGDVAIAQEYALAKNHNVIEFDINPEGLISGTYIVDSRDGLYQVEGAHWGATVGAGARPNKAVTVLQLQHFIETGGGQS